MARELEIAWDLAMYRRIDSNSPTRQKGNDKPRPVQTAGPPPPPGGKKKKFSIEITEWDSTMKEVKAHRQTIA
jgi:hypothetical protein